MTERFIPLSKFTGEPVDILERLAQMMNQELFDINKLPLTEEYKKNQEDKKRKAEEEAKQALDDEEEIKKISSDR